MDNLRTELVTLRHKQESGEREHMQLHDHVQSLAEQAAKQEEKTGQLSASLATTLVRTDQLQSAMQSSEANTKANAKSLKTLSKEMWKDREQKTRALTELENARSNVEKRMRDLHRDVQAAEIRHKDELDIFRRESYEARNPLQEQVRALAAEVEAAKAALDELRSPIMQELRNLQCENEGFLKELKRTQSNYRALVADFLCLLEEKN